MMAASLAIAGGAALIALWIFSASSDVSDLVPASDSFDPAVCASCPQPPRLRAASASMVSNEAVLSRQQFRMFISSSHCLFRLGGVVAPAFIVPEEEVLTCVCPWCLSSLGGGRMVNRRPWPLPRQPMSPPYLPSNTRYIGEM